MIFSVYEPITDSNAESASVLVTGFMEAERYEYHKRWQGVGSFTLTVPADANGIQNVRPDMILFVDEGGQGNINDCLIINDVEDDGVHVVLSGVDLKGLLAYRMTLFPQAEIEAGTYGYDAREGTTGAIISGYIDYNCINAADTDRNIPGLTIGNTSGGLQEDAYMSRLQPLNEVVEDICRNADIGYDISFTPTSNAYQFDLVEGADRTNATGTQKCVFADFLMNTESISRKEKTADRRNVIWTINGSDEEKAVVTAIYKTQDPDEKSGFMRRETVMTASCDIDLVESYVESKTTEMVDKIEVKFTLADPLMYGRAFLCGDKVTVMKNGIGHDRRVIEVVKSYSAGKRSVDVQLGDIPVKKPFERVSYNFSCNADTLKEIALETGSIKNKQYKSFYSVTDPTLDANNNVQIGDRWIKIDNDNDQNIETEYRRDRVEVETRVTRSTPTYTEVWTPVYNVSTGGSGGVGENVGDHNERFNGYVNGTDGHIIRSGDYNHAEGFKNTIQSESYSHAEGYQNTAQGGNYNHIEGDYNTLTASNRTHVGGISNTVTGASCSIVSGYMNTASGSISYDIISGVSNKVYDVNRALVIGDSNFVAAISSAIVCGQHADTQTITTPDNGDLRFLIGGSQALGNVLYITHKGNVYARGSYNSTGADYAEYFEWADGNPDNEYRCGMLVALKGEKIVPAHGYDILGVVSAAPSVVGNSASLTWNGKFVKNVYGEIITTPHGEPILNPDYDPEKQYIPREQRPEWAAVGLVGRLIVRDNGSCKAGEWVVGNNGYAFPSLVGKTNVRCLKRIDDTHVEVFIR